MSTRIELLHDGRSIVVDGEEALVGRTAACTVQVVHPLVSRAHFRLVATETGVEVKDLGSSNGTFVNDTRISGVTPVRAGDEVGIGREGPRFRLMSAIVDGRDVAGDDPEVMQETVLVEDNPAVAKVSANVRVPSDEPLTSEIAPGIPVARPLTDLPGNAPPEGRAEDHEDEPGKGPTGTDIVEPTTANAPANIALPRPDLRLTRDLPADATAEIPATDDGLRKGLLVGIAVGLFLLLLISIVTPIADALPEFHVLRVRTGSSE